MAETSYPWTGTVTGDAGPYSSKRWIDKSRWQTGEAWSLYRGVLRGSGAVYDTALKPTAQGPATSTLDVPLGDAFVRGTYYELDADTTVAITANASGNPRIDTIILRKSWALQTVRIETLEGTPGASPVAPTLTNASGTIWEIPLADIAVANGFSVINGADITDRREFANDNGVSGLVGEIKIFAGAVVPSGWLLCYGQAVSRVTYNILFQSIIEAYGVGDGSTTFNLPDLRGRIPLGKDDMGGASANNVTDAAADVRGGVGGLEDHTLTAAELAAHNHHERVGYLTGGPGLAYIDNGVDGANWALEGVFAGTTGTTPVTTATDGGSDDPHNNLQPWQTVTYIIKY